MVVFHSINWFIIPDNLLRHFSVGSDFAEPARGQASLPPLISPARYAGSSLTSLWQTRLAPCCVVAKLLANIFYSQTIMVNTIQNC